MYAFTLCNYNWTIFKDTPPELSETCGHFININSVNRKATIFTLYPYNHIIVDNNYNYLFTFKPNTEFGAIIMRCVDKHFVNEVPCKNSKCGTFYLTNSSWNKTWEEKHVINMCSVTSLSICSTLIDYVNIWLGRWSLEQNVAYCGNNSYFLPFLIMHVFLNFVNK